MFSTPKLKLNKFMNSYLAIYGNFDTANYTINESIKILFGKIWQ